MLVDGVDEPYDMDQLRRMYSYLDKHGELYFIEVLEGVQVYPGRRCDFFRKGYACCYRGEIIPMQGDPEEGCHGAH